MGPLPTSASGVATGPQTGLGPEDALGQGGVQSQRWRLRESGFLLLRGLNESFRAGQWGPPADSPELPCAVIYLSLPSPSFLEDS
jgi:hypothetical protein